MTVALPIRPQTSARRIVRNPRILSGEPTLEGTRVPVRSIVVARRYLESIDEIIDAYPMLDQESVAAALTFYQGHQDEIDRHIAENEDPAS
jgi:uncharacterized protein (DUF433 family)